MLFLGSDEIHPKQIMYHVPHYLRGIHKNKNYFQMMIKRRDHYAKTPLPKAQPSKWQGWNLLMMHEYRWINRHIDQNWWANYKGIKEGPVKNPFKKKLFWFVSKFHLKYVKQWSLCNFIFQNSVIVSYQQWQFTIYIFLTEMEVYYSTMNGSGMLFSFFLWKCKKFF